MAEKNLPLLEWIRRLLTGTPHLRIYPGEYLDRWYLIPRNRFFNIYLHCFHGSGPSRPLHDHPWWNLSILLKGSYLEWVPAKGYRMASDVLDFHVHKRGHFVLRRPTDSHDLMMLSQPGEKVWTLFITGPVRREWGFWDRDGEWVQWEAYYRKHNLSWE